MMKIETVPSAYIEGHIKAREHDSAIADNYIKHTTIGDPELDPLMEELASSLPLKDLYRFIGAGIEQQDEILRRAPQALRDFFDKINAPPPWLDYQAFNPAIRAFNTNVDLMLTAFVTAVLVEGFSTLIAKSFRITGRVGATTRRLKQNNRHMMEIFYPDGLRRENDGWKLSTRIRFVHTRIRGMLAKSDDWDHEAWGTPVSAAHLGFAISVFSKRLLEYSLLVGAKYSQEEKESVLSVWRYAGYLMGIPETILYTSGAEAHKIYKMGYLCEPTPDADSIAVANLLIKSIPSVAGIEDPVEKEKLITLAYRLSSALIGNHLAAQFQFPKNSTMGVLFTYRMKQYIQRFLRTKQIIRSSNFTQLLQISVYDEKGLSYRMPDHVDTSKSSDW